MGTGKMHAGEVHIDAALVGRLIAEQFPVPAVQVNAIYRLGGHLCARLPRLVEWAHDLKKEWHWLSKLAPHLPLRVPEPIGKGHPTSSYPFSRAVYEWIRRPAVFGRSRRRRATGGPGSRAVRGRAAPDRSRRGTPQRAQAAPRTRRRHARGDSVIDFGGTGVGDPAADVIAAWSVCGRTGRGAFRDVLDVDDGTWNRARGFALHQAALIIPYYGRTNPEFVSLARRTVEEVPADV